MRFQVKYFASDTVVLEVWAKFCNIQTAFCLHFGASLGKDFFGSKFAYFQINLCKFPLAQILRGNIVSHAF